MNRAVFVAVALASVAAHADSDTVDYVVQPGDTCMGIATGLLGGRDKVDEIHRLNPKMGPTPHNLVPGSILKLPAAAKHSADAQVARTHRTVEVRRAGDDRWTAAEKGTDLYRAWRVGARGGANADIVFIDKSRLELRENTVVVIYGATSAALPTPSAILESGVLRTRLAELDGKQPVAIETPSATVGATAGSTIVEVNRSGATLVSNHVGSAVTMRGKVGPTRKIVPGYGADAPKNKPASEPRPLPPSPAWDNPPSLAIGWRSDGASLRAGWTAVAEAARYRVEVAPDGGAPLQFEVPATVTSLELHDMPAGALAISISSVDATGLEGRPTATGKIASVLLGIAGDAAAQPIELAQGAAPQPRTIALGASLDPVDGCTASFMHAGDTVVHCTGAADLPVHVTGVTVAPRPEAKSDVGHELSLAFAVTGAMVGDLVAIGDDHAQVTSVAKIDGGIRVGLRALKAGTAHLRFALRTPTGDVELSSQDVPIAEGPPPPPPPPAVRDYVWLTGIAGIERNRGLGAASVDAWLLPHVALGAGLTWVYGNRSSVAISASYRVGDGRFAGLVRATQRVDFGGAVGLGGALGFRARVNQRAALYVEAGGWRLGGQTSLEVGAGLSFNYSR